MGDLLRAPEWYHFSTKNSNAVWTKSKPNPNFQLVNKPSLGSTTLVKRKSRFWAPMDYVWNRYLLLPESERSSYRKILRKNHLRDPTTISWPVSFKISEGSRLLILCVPFTFADFFAIIGLGTEHIVFPVLHLSYTIFRPMTGTYSYKVMRHIRRKNS